MNTAGCITGWINYANELSQAALKWSSHDTLGCYFVICFTSLSCKAAVWIVDDVVHLIKISFKKILIYLFLPSVAYDPVR